MSTTASTRWAPSVPLCSASQPESFAYESTIKRWPAILTGIVSELAAVNTLCINDEDKPRVVEGQAIIASISEMIYEMRHDRELSSLQDSGEPSDVAVYNDELERMKARNQGTWFTASWLYAECYMYRRLRCLFSASTLWKTFDPFATQKINAFRSSATGIMTLAASIEGLIKSRGTVPRTEEILQTEWTEILEMCLWGNATDLSLLTSLTHEEIQALQSVERGSNFILKYDDTWSHVKQLKSSRIDIVLDNSGFELFTDLVLADWFLTLSPYCSEVVFHPKNIPWFVSDVMPLDFSVLITSLLDPTFFPADNGASESQKQDLEKMVKRWQGYIAAGKFRLSVPGQSILGGPGAALADFWTSAMPFSDLPAFAPALLTELQKAGLVIFKGDLNYRKLTSDACWPTTTAFEDTLGPLKGKINLLSLRTCKADVVVGIPEGKAEELDVADPSWRVSGKYAVVSFSARQA